MENKLTPPCKGLADLLKQSDCITSDTVEICHIPYPSEDFKGFQGGGHTAEGPNVYRVTPKLK